METEEHWAHWAEQRETERMKKGLMGGVSDNHSRSSLSMCISPKQHLDWQLQIMSVCRWLLENYVQCLSFRLGEQNKRSPSQLTCVSCPALSSQHVYLALVFLLLNKHRMWPLNILLMERQGEGNIHIKENWTYRQLCYVIVYSMTPSPRLDSYEFILL